MIRGHKRKQDREKFYRVNERIGALTLRVLDANGKQIGILPKGEAQNIAKEKGLDLVEIASNANPPVVKIVDFKKFLYQQQKKRQEEKKKTKVSQNKELRLGPFINDHDLEVLVRRAREFLEDGHKVKFVVKFRGRQITHPEFGQKTLDKAIERLSDISKIEREKHFEGRQLVCLLSPEKGNKNAKEEDKKIGKQTL